MTPDKIKNIGVFAHVDAGKTTITEQMLYISGSIRKAGRVDDGTTQTDFNPIERQRGISVFSACTGLSWNGYYINLADTPGHMDFAGEVERSLASLDGAVLVVSAVEGIQSHTENLWNALSRFNIPRVVFVNKTDRAGSHAKAVIEEMADTFGADFVMLHTPENEGTKECGLKDNSQLFTELYELLAEYNDTVAERYINDEPMDKALLQTVFTECAAKGSLFPVVCGSALFGVGIKELLDAVVKYLPSADRFLKKSLSGIIYKIEHDKTMGKIAHIRMYGGSLRSRDSVVLQNASELKSAVLEERQPREEKISQIRKFNGQKYMDTGTVGAGDIAALYGLQSAKIGDIIGEYVENRSCNLLNPFLSVKISPKNDGELTPLVNAVKELCDEEPYLNYKWEKAEREINVSITGEIQMEILGVLLKDRYNLDADFSKPSVIYKETPSKEGDGYEAYTMPKPCWAVVRLHFEPLSRGAGVIFDKGHVPSDKLFYKYQTHIKASFFSSLEQGLYGWEVTDFKATLTGGEHHTIHTHPLDFFVATPMAVMNGLYNTGTTLLEPFVKMRFCAGEELLGRIISDITQMRGVFDAPVISRGVFTLESYVPVAASFDYPIRFAGLTSGKGSLNARFEDYRECPLELGAVAKRRGISPLDRSKWILYKRGAIQ